MAKAAVKTRHRTATIPERIQDVSPAETKKPFDWQWYYLFAASLIIAFAVYSPSLNGTLIFDDFNLPFAYPNAAHQPASYWIGGVRPALMATYWLNFLISGTRTFSYHLGNILIHGVTALLMFFIFERVLRLSPANDSSDSGRRRLAAFGAVLFLVHPAQTEPVAYIAGRSELVSGFFFFAAWLVFLRDFNKNTTLFGILKILVLAGLAVLGKESAISLPALLFLTDFYFADRPVMAQIKRRIALYSIFLAGGIGATVVILRALAKDTSVGTLSGHSRFEYALTQCKAILSYVRIFFLPAGLNGDYQMPFYHSLADGAAAVYATALLLFIVLIIWLYQKDRLISFGLAAFLLMLAPTSSIIPINDAMADRRLYLSIAGLILALLGVIRRVSITRVWRIAGATTVLFLLAGLSFVRSSVWASDYNFWSDAGRNNPANSRAHYGLGTAMLNRGDCGGAAHEFAVALEAPSAKNRAELYWNQGLAYQCNKESAKALPSFRSFAAIHPTADAWNRVGVNEAILGNAGAAFEAFEEALKVDPNNAEAYAYRGMARLATNNPAGAEADLRHALQIDPANVVAAGGLQKLAAQN